MEKPEKNIIFNTLKRHNITGFVTPSHSQNGFIIPDAAKNLGKIYFKKDFSEQEGLDNLANPQGMIQQAAEKIARIYDARKSFFLVNGSTSGILAAMLSILSDAEKVLVARNCHKAVYNGLVLTGAVPYWIVNEKDNDWDIIKPLKTSDIELAIKKNPDAKALILTNPSYEGLCCDVRGISELCKKRNIILIVDEAHGALWNFSSRLFTPAILDGADISVQSLHKTAGGINPGALLHVSMSSEISISKLQSALNIVNTTSPSYPLLINIENTVDFLDSNNGKKELAKLLNNIDNFKNTLKHLENVEIFEGNNDKTRILLKIRGLRGHELSETLYTRYKIEDEISNERSVVFLTGLGTTKQKLKKLEKAIKEIAKTAYNKLLPEEEFSMPAPRVIISPRKAYFKGSRAVSFEDAVGKVAAEAIVPYPPGIPILLPGEKIQKEHAQYIHDGSIEIVNG